MNGMKYIVFESPGMGFKEMAIFSNTIEHKKAAISLIGPLYEDYIVSAGFMDMNHYGVGFFGESVSLGVKSDPESDKELFNRQFNY